jgi:hypothetical protein
LSVRDFRGPLNQNFYWESKVLGILRSPLFKTCSEGREITGDDNLAEIEPFHAVDENALQIFVRDGADGIEAGKRGAPHSRHTIANDKTALLIVTMLMPSAASIYLPRSLRVMKGLPALGD